MEKRKLIETIFNFIVITLFMAAGITVLVLRSLSEGYDEILLSTVLFIAGGCKLIVYFINRGYRNPRNITLISSIAMIGLGLIILLSGRNMEILCFGWGIMEVVLGAIEVHIDLIEIREDRLAIAELVVNLGSMIFGILLCIELFHGLTVHLIFLGISLILLSVIATLKTIRFLIADKKERDAKKQPVENKE